MSVELKTEREGNVLLVPIEIRQTDQKRIDEMLAQLKQLDAETKGLPGFDPDTVQRLQPEGQAAMDKFDLSMKKWMEKSGLDAADVGQFMMFMRSPAQGIMRALMTNPYVAAAMVAILIIPQVWDWLTDKGRPFNKFFVRKIVDEGNVGRSRQSRQEVRFGFRQVIFVRFSGETDVYTAFNSFEAVRAREIENLEIFQIRSGRLGP